MFNGITQEEVEKRFGYHRATDETVELHQVIRRSYILLAGIIIDTVPGGREQSLALTALQESAMWSNAGIACNLAPLDLNS